MKQNTNALQNFQVIREGELDPEYHPTGIKLARLKAAEAVKSKAAQAKAAIVLEVRMIVFDALHRTNYRKIRHQLIEEQKRLQFEASIGLTR